MFFFLIFFSQSSQTHPKSIPKKIKMVMNTIFVYKTPSLPTIFPSKVKMVWLRVSIVISSEDLMVGKSRARSVFWKIRNQTENQKNRTKKTKIERNRYFGLVSVFYFLNRQFSEPNRNNFIYYKILLCINFNPIHSKILDFLHIICFKC